MIYIAMLLITMICLLAFTIYYMKRYVVLKQRVDKISAPFIRSQVGDEDAESKQDALKKQYVVIAKRMLNFFNLLTVGTTKTFSKRLANAGWLSKNALVIFLSMQVISLFTMVFLGIMMIFFVPFFVKFSLLVKGIIIIVFLYIGYRFPEWYLARKTKAYRIRLRRSILEFFELFLICIEAGFGNDKALERIYSELINLHPELCEQVNLLITELRILPSRNVAWDNFSERTGLDEIKILVQIIKQSEKLGASMGQALRAQIDMFRSERLSQIEHKAMRLPTLLTLPLVGFIFPTLLLVILGPAILKAMAAFSGVK